MPPTNREWKQFARRWDAESRLGKFLAAAVLFHLIVAGLIAIPAHSNAIEQEAALRAAEEARQEERRQEAEKAAAETEAVAIEATRQELAVEQLRGYLDELAGDLLTPDELDEFWDDLAPEFEVDLNELAKMLDDPAQFDLARTEKQLEKMREELLRKFAERVEERRARAQRDELMRRMDTAARKLIEGYQAELRQRVGDAVAGQAGKVLEAESAAQLARLQQAERELTAAVDSARQAVQRLEASKQPLATAAALQATARAAKDSAGETRAGEQARQQSRPIGEARTSLEKAGEAMSKAARELTTDAPAIGRQLAQLVSRDGEMADRAIEAARRAAEEKNATEASKNSSTAQHKAREVLAGAERLRSVLRLQLAREQAARIADAAENSAERAERLAKEKTDSERAKDARRTAETREAVQASARMTAITARKTEELREQIRQAEPKQASKDESAGKADSRVTPLANALTKAEAELKQSAPDRAVAPLREAAATAGRIERDLRDEQKKLGVDPDATGQEDIRRQLASMQREAGKLLEPINERFARAYRERAEPGLKKQFESAAAVLARAKVDPKLIEEMKREAEALLGPNLARQVEPDSQARQGTAERLPRLSRSSEDPPRESRKRPDLAEATRRAAGPIVEQMLSAIAEAGTRSSALASLGQPLQAPTGKGRDLATRLENLQQQLAAGRRDALGQANPATLAAARRRSLERGGAIRRLRALGDIDADAFRRILETIKDRGRITGDLLQLRGAVGELVEAREEFELRPALVSSPAVPADSVPDAPADRKIAEPTFKTNRFNGIPFVALDAIKIDGDLSDWKGLPVYPLDPVLKGARKGTVAAPSQQRAHVAYNSQGLLVAVENFDVTSAIEDNRPLGAFWENDCLEIFIDTLNTKFSKRGEVTTHQFYAFPLGHASDREAAAYEAQAVGNPEFDQWKQVRYPQGQVRRAGRKTPNGWAMELFIPKSLLRRGEIKPGRIIGLNLQLDSGCDLYYYWTGGKTHSSVRPNTWGDVQFLGSDARMEVLDPKKDEPAASVVPGRPVRVRVADPDMNLDEGKKDRVAVTLRGEVGENLTLVLEETANGSGVFEATLGTALCIGSPTPGVLGVFEGETVTVEYLDQARAYGERNVPVTAKFTIGSIGARLGRDS